jgi:endogenous inhibitor of DNA gyrase (YacG/DUF329 family)
MTPEGRGRTRGKCPICGRPSEPDYRPFCSRRCADVDLARWLSGTYAIPDRGEGEEEPAAEGNSGERDADIPESGRSQ